LSTGGIFARAFSITVFWNFADDIIGALVSLVLQALGG
jgi:hypothetical protein